ncbi:MAG: sterol desaturase family protein [Ilumatobacter sp.]|uniref:sterol desaturase family protein n=1 Tax=Ilumatobacter sp. TaxID=1967498 RepID=UPI003C7829C5
MSSSTIAGQSESVRADSLVTKRATLGVFARRGSARVFGAVAAVAVVGRIVVGDSGRGDLVVILATAIAIGPVEWVIHRFLLHADEQAWTSRRLGTGDGHRRHHIYPPELDWLLLAGSDATIFISAFGVLTALWTLPLAAVLDASGVGMFLTGWAGAAIALLHYEWVHLLVHTRYRCRTPYYRRLARNHRLHHFRNERYWLGVTTNSGDRLLRTYPLAKGDVPLSETARTLGG